MWIPPILTGLVTIVVSIYSASAAAKNGQKRAIEDRFIKFEVTLKEAEKEIENRLDIFRREIGETMLAFRERTNELSERHRELELFVRDKFVSREEFRDGMSRVEDSQKRMEIKLDDVLKAGFVRPGTT